MQFAVMIFIVLTKLIAEISEHNYVADNKRT